VDPGAETGARGLTADASVPPSAFRLPPSIILFLVLFVSYCYFFPGPGWGSVSRMNLVMALVDERTVRLDAYRGTTGDRAFYEGHWFHEKAPGGACLGLLPYRLYAWFVPRPKTFDDPAWSRYYGRALYVTTCLSTGLLSALAGVVLFHLVCGLFGHPGGAMATAVIYGLATPAFVYATQFQGHQMAAALFILALACARSAANRRRAFHLVAAGLFAGFAVATEYQDVFLAVAVLVYLLAALRPRRRLAWFVLGAVPPALLVLAYNYVCFGHPLQVGYLFVDAQAWQAVHGGGFAGFGWPRLDVWQAMLLRLNRGLFIFSPVLLLVVPGALLWARGAGRRDTTGTLFPRAELLLCLAVVVLFPVFLSGFRPIMTGHQFGPRFLVAMLPFAALLTAPMVPRWRYVPAVVLGSVSALIALAGAAVNPEFSPQLPNPIAEYLIPRLVAGDFPATFYGAHAALGVTQPIEFRPFNLGMLMGLEGLASLLPLVGVWAVGLWGLSQTTERSTFSRQQATGKAE
jgi:hypothetical protein